MRSQSFRYTNPIADHPTVAPMQTTLNLDESLLNEALQLTNLTDQEELINLALRELVRSRRKKNLLDLAGQIQFTEDFDHKTLRETRHAAD
jgi:Arc/MetJ family transcription regulator